MRSLKVSYLKKSYSLNKKYLNIFWRKTYPYCQHFVKVNKSVKKKKNSPARCLPHTVGCCSRTLLQTGWGDTDLGARFAGFVPPPQHLSALWLWATQVAWISSAQRESFTENSLQSGGGSRIPRRQQQGSWQESWLAGRPGWSRLPAACRPSGLGAVSSTQPWESKVFLTPSVPNPWLNPVKTSV